jgi:Type IV secretion system pilin
MFYFFARSSVAMLAAAMVIVLLVLVDFTNTFAAGIVPCSGSDCNWCSLIQLIQNLINYAIYFGVLIGALVFAYGGASYMLQGFVPGSAEHVTRAKGILRGVIVGIIVVLIGWLVIDTLLKALVDEGKFGVWNKISCDLQTTTDTKGNSLPTNSSDELRRKNRRPQDDTDRR